MNKWWEKHVKRKFCRVAKILVLFYTQFDFCFNARLLICLVGKVISGKSLLKNDKIDHPCERNIFVAEPLTQIANLLIN